MYIYTNFIGGKIHRLCITYKGPKNLPILYNDYNERMVIFIMLKEIDWKLAITGDIGMLAFEAAIKDPECGEELKPIREKREEFLIKSHEKEKEIIQRYKDKYYDKLMKRKLFAKEEVSRMLLEEFKERRRS